jgi:L-alanine-DL-glutamate epimerase-like enolase superfamily enzyme
VKVEIRRLSARLRAPFQSSRGSVVERPLLLLVLTSSDGHVGLGEAAPLESYDGVGIDDVQGALEDCRELLERADGVPHEDVLAACARLAVLPQALAPVDLALWDLAGKRAGQPVWRLLGGSSAPAVEVNHAISAPDRAGAAREAAWARQAGFRCLKVKVGRGDDAGRLAAVRAAAGPQMSIRVDANGAWSVEQARAALEALAAVGLELCEEPVRGLADAEALSRLTAVPLALDESASAPGALERRVCAAVCLKIVRCGGISGVLDAARRARTAGYELYLASTLDGPLGLAGALHAAAVIAPERPCGLATLPLFDQPAPPLTGPRAPAGSDALFPRDGKLAVPAGPGLGTGLEAWYRDLA